MNLNPEVRNNAWQWLSLILRNVLVSLQSEIPSFLLE
uniref:Uncharacterized protein n=1 Tax=Rhizophora mucronata TaxID=61149 RepID=A0A2P2NVZ9_RHIMU